MDVSAVTSAHEQKAEINQAAAATNHTVDLRAALTRKRKSPSDSSDNSNRQSALETAKKVKLADPKSSKEDHQGDGISLHDRYRLPGELWQHIFTFCPPRTLGQLLKVNRVFNAYLDPSSAVQCEPPPRLLKTVVSALKPNSIWQTSRRRFWPSMPSPLKGKTELYMWQLSCSTPCQHCGSSLPQQKDSSDSWQPGPGKDGIAVVWPFDTRSCGPCLLTKSEKVCSARQNRRSWVLVLT